MIDGLPVGGAETLLIGSLEEFSSSHVDDEHFLATVFEDGPLLSGFRQREARHVNLGLRTLNLVAAVRRLRAFIRRHAIDVVHSHLYHATIISRLALPHGVKLISTYHTGFHSPTSIEYSWKRLLVDRLTCRPGHCLIFVSASVQRDIQEGLPCADSGTVVPNFASRSFCPGYRYSDEPSLKLVAVGNLREQKNHCVAIEALAALRDYPISLDIYGRGPLEAILRERIAQLGVRVRIITDARISSEILTAYDAFLMTSRHEGMPLALMEAMRTGLPSVLNDISSLRETARDAALYFERDSETGLADVLMQCLQDKAQLQELSARATRHAADFTVERYVESLHALYARMLTQP